MGSVRAGGAQRAPGFIDKPPLSTRRRKAQGRWSIGHAPELSRSWPWSRLTGHLARGDSRRLEKSLEPWT